MIVDNFEFLGIDGHLDICNWLYETFNITKKEALLELKQAITDYREKIKVAENMVLKYEDQQLNVRNNREYDAIIKEIDLQKLEIQVSEKKIKASHEAIKEKEAHIEQIQLLLEEKQKEIEKKKEELQSITKESEEEEQSLHDHRTKLVKQIEERLIHAYQRVRNNVRNGLAVVIVEREACGGCFNIVPPQRQVEIKSKKKIIVCEHCGRIFAEVVEQMPKATDKKSKK